MTSAVVHRSPRWDRLRRWLLSDAGAASTAAFVFLVGWQLLTLIAPRVPGPVAVIEIMWIEVSAGDFGSVRRGEFWEHYGWTLLRYGAGLVIGFVAGLLVGALIGSSNFARALISDTVLVLLALPAFVWAFLTTMWFGIGWQAPVLTVAFTAFPFVAVNIAQGVRAITPDLKHMSTAFGVSRAKRFRHLIVAGVMGYLFAGLRFAMIVSWNGVLLSEWFNGQNGVGFRTRFWFDANRYPGFLGWVISFIVFIVVLDRLVLTKLQDRAFRWRNPGGELSDKDLNEV
ncbi:MAG: ABC transporter permease subunit [Acidimicrobiia bacterium]|nr:ABC transporter permease subunit [Acidimicrobiia bacterium]